jgi:hypothetical protein
MRRRLKEVGGLNTKAVVLEGESGIGKTQSVLEVMDGAEKMGFEVVCSHGVFSAQSSSRKSTPSNGSLPPCQGSRGCRQAGVDGGGRMKLAVLSSIFNAQFPDTVPIL